MPETPEQIVVRGLCSCGRRYRIRNPRPYVRIPCPHCRKPVKVTPEIYEAAGGVIVPREAPTTQKPPSVSDLPWAVLIDRGALVVAPAGSEPGLTGEKIHESEESRLYEAMRGRTRLDEEYQRDEWRSPLVERWFTPGEKVERTLAGDLLASFYLAGSRRNLVLIVISTFTLGVLAMFTLLPILHLGSFACVLWLFGLIGLIVTSGTILQFFTSVLVTTAGGDDDIPLNDAEWTFVDNVAWPILVILLITALCGIPATIVGYYVPEDAEARATLIGLGIAGGSLFWPIAVLAVLVGNSLSYLRPDWLLKAIVSLGPAYLLAWGMMWLTLGVGYATNWAFQQMRVGSFWMELFSPFWFIGINLYFGYVLFRTIGLVQRHFGERMPKNMIGQPIA